MSFTRLARERSSSSIALVFIHGRDSSKETWLKFLDSHLGSHDCFGLDLPGHGDLASLSPDELDRVYESSVKPLIDSLVARVGDLVPKTSHERFLLVGHSMGARVAVRLADALGGKQRLVGLVLEDMDMKKRQRKARKRMDRLWPGSWDTEGKLAESMAVYGFDADWVTRKHEQGLVKRLSTSTSDSEVWTVGWSPYATRLAHNLLLATDGHDEFERVAARLPTLLVHCGAGNGAVSKRSLARMRDSVPGLVCVEIPESAHSVHGVTPEPFAHALETFIKNNI